MGSRRRTMIATRYAVGSLIAGWALLDACKSDPCKDAQPTVHLELIVDGFAPDAVDSLEILLDAGSDRFRKVYDLGDELRDGRTSISVEIVPAPSASFPLVIEVNAFDAAGTTLGASTLRMQAEPNGCNEGEIRIQSVAPPGKDAGPPDAEPIDAEPIDAEPIDADPIDAAPQDAEPIDAEPVDAEPGDAADAGCPDDDSDFVCNDVDNCPLTPNPGQEDTDGIAAYPILYMPVGIGIGTPVAFTDIDDSVSAPIPIGIGFEWFGAQVNDVRVSSNGFITFDNNNNDGCCNGQNIPDISDPDNLIALAWNDLEIPDVNSVEWEVDFSAPNPTFTIAYQFVRICCGPSSDIITVEATLFQNTNAIEVHTTVQPDLPDFTRGIEGPNGNRAAYLPGEARGRFPIAGSSVRYTTGSAPDGIGDACSNAH
jgi:hypothetical protein